MQCCIGSNDIAENTQFKADKKAQREKRNVMKSINKLCHERKKWQQKKLAKYTKHRVCELSAYEDKTNAKCEHKLLSFISIDFDQMISIWIECVHCIISRRKFKYCPFECKLLKCKNQTKFRLNDVRIFEPFDLEIEWQAILIYEKSEN